MAREPVRRASLSRSRSDGLAGRYPLPCGTRSDPAVFCREMLPRTSRTFALNVPLLLPKLGNIVAMAYLLCRVADTVEDEATIPADVRAELLGEISTLVALPEDWREQSAALADRACRLLGGAAVADQVRLVADLPVLLDGLADHLDQVRELVRICVHDMTAGMAETVVHQLDCSTGMEDLDEVLGYCDIVAGTVGTMLTGLFAWHSGDITAVLSELEPRAAAFGRVL